METRGYSLEKCESIIAKQNDLDYYCLQSDIYMNENPDSDYYGIRIVPNNSNIEDLYEVTDKVMEEINGRIGKY